MATIAADSTLTKSNSLAAPLPTPSQPKLGADYPLPRRTDWWALIVWMAGAGILVLLHIVDILVWILGVPR